MGTGGSVWRNPCHRESMDNPKQRYPLSVANRLRPRPCPDCQKKSWPRPDPSFHNTADPDLEVAVAWYCPDELCNKNDDF